MKHSLSEQEQPEENSGPAPKYQLKIRGEIFF